MMKDCVLTMTKTAVPNFPSHNTIPQYWAKRGSDMRVYRPKKRFIRSKVQQTTKANLTSFNELWGGVFLRVSFARRPKLILAKTPLLFCSQLSKPGNSFTLSGGLCWDN